MIATSLKNSWRIMRNALPLILVWAGYLLMCDLLNAYLTTGPQLQGEERQAITIAQIAAWGIMLIPYYYFYAGTLAYMRDQLNFQQAGLATAFTSGAKYFLRIILFNLALFALLWVFFVGLMLLILLISFFIGTPSPIETSIITGLSVIGLLPALCLIILMLFASMVIVADDSSVGAAIKKSSRMVRAHKGTALGLLALYLVCYAPTTALSFVKESLPHHTSVQLALSVVTSSLTAFFGVYLAGVFMDVYLRLSKEHAKEHTADTAP